MVHNGLRGHTRRYKCKDCVRRFDGGIRRNKPQVITDYIEGKQTMEQLADKYKVSSKTIARDLTDMRYIQRISKDKQVVIQMDTTYWGRRFGLMAIKDSLRKKVLWRKYVSHETIADYLEGVEWLRDNGFKIYGAVCDGMHGLLKALSLRYPVQMCQFHQQLIIRRYLADDPELEASRALLDLVNDMTRVDKPSFIGAFNDWYEKYNDVLNERIHDKRLRTPPFMRPRLRSAYLSLKRNMKWLWTFSDYSDRLVPNTDNGLEGVFSDIKSKVRVHSGMSKEHRKRFIDEYLMRQY